MTVADFVEMFDAYDDSSELEFECDTDKKVLHLHRLKAVSRIDTMAELETETIILMLG